MTGPSGISRRIEQCIEHLQHRDHEGALVHLFPAIDKTASTRRPGVGVGNRIRAFLKDEEVLITAIGTGHVLKDCKFDGMSLEEALYEFGRTPIAHEGELDPRLQFNDGGGLLIGRDRWNLPGSYIAGMSAAVILAPENASEKLNHPWSITILGKPFLVNEIWGARDQVRKHLCEIFRDPDLFA
jgi:hypothetical protein